MWMILQLKSWVRFPSISPLTMVISCLGCQFLVHYGHSCLVPVQDAKIKVMYVFVEIYFDTSHLVECIRKEFPPSAVLMLMGTVQFTGVLHGVLAKLKEDEGSYAQVSIPQARPLSSGETLGCTAAVLPSCDALVFVADGRFHLEAAMIRNPTVAAYRYDPYSKVLTREGYDVDLMKRVRLRAIERARGGHVFGLILGTLGHQGRTSPLHPCPHPTPSKSVHPHSHLTIWSWGSSFPSWSRCLHVCTVVCSGYIHNLLQRRVRRRQATFRPPGQLTQGQWKEGSHITPRNLFSRQ